MTTPIFSGYVPRFGPVAQIVPFTYREGYTFLERLEALKSYVTNDLVKFVNENFEELGKDFESEVNRLFVEVSAALATQTEGVDNKIEELTDLVNTAVQNIIDATITVSDPVIDAVVAESESDTRATLDALYAAKSLEDDVSAQSANIATMSDNLDAKGVAITALNDLVEGITTAVGEIEGTVTTALEGRLSEGTLNAKYGYFLKGRDYGIAANGVTDDAANLAALLSASATFGLVAVLEPKKTVLIDSAVTVPSGARLNLNGSTILRGPTGSGVMFELLDRSNIEIWGGKFDGNKAAYASPTEWRHNINLDNSHNIHLHDLSSDRAKGDGIYIGGTVAHSTNIRIENVVCDGNHRQGLSVIAVDDLTVSASRFINTSGTAPQSGVDVEPNNGSQVCTNIRFINCTMSGNAGHGYLEALQPTRSAKQGNVTLIGCTLDNNAEAGVRLTASENFQMIGGSLSGNLFGLLHNTNTMLKAKLTSVAITKNKGHGVNVSGPYSDFTIASCTVEANGQAQTGDGLNIAPSTTSNNFKFIGNYSGQSPQRNGITLGASALNTQLIGNAYGGNTGANRSGESVVTIDLDVEGKRTVTGAKGGNAALTSLLSGLALRGIITDSTT